MTWTTLLPPGLCVESKQVLDQTIARGAVAVGVCDAGVDVPSDLSWSRGGSRGYKIIDVLSMMDLKFLEFYGDLGGPRALEKKKRIILYHIS